MKFREHLERDVVPYNYCQTKNARHSDKHVIIPTSSLNWPSRFYIVSINFFIFSPIFLMSRNSVKCVSGLPLYFHNVYLRSASVNIMKIMLTKKSNIIVHNHTQHPAKWIIKNLLTENVWIKYFSKYDFLTAQYKNSQFSSNNNINCRKYFRRLSFCISFVDQNLDRIFFTAIQKVLSNKKFVEFYKIQLQSNNGFQ